MSKRQGDLLPLRNQKLLVNTADAYINTKHMNRVAESLKQASSIPQ